MIEKVLSAQKLLKKNVCRFSKRFQRKNAFTIAELLITIVIIGLISVLIIPFFISKIQDLVRAKRIENIEQKFGKATDKMLALDGMNDYSGTADFVNTLKKHLNIVKICANSDLESCWPTDTVKLSDGRNWKIALTTTGNSLKMINNQENEWDDTIGIIIADGTHMILSYNKKCDIDPFKFSTWSGSKTTSTKCIAAVYDWNGSKMPNLFGVSTDNNADVIPLNANGLGLSCFIELNGTCMGTFFKPEGLTYDECNELKKQNKLDRCYYDYSLPDALDYWGGAVKQCGGTKNMVSEKDLLALREKLREGNWDANIANLGLSIQEFLVFSGERDRSTADGIKSVYFYPGGNAGYWPSRQNSSAIAICKY